MIDELKYVLPHDSSNALILPSNAGKRAKKLDGDDEIQHDAKKRKLKPTLSNKKRKKLQKILERKKKRCSRIEVLEKLSKSQITNEELLLFTPVARMQEKYHKKHEKEEVFSNDEKLVPNSLAGSGKKKYRRTNVKTNQRATSGPYFETDSSSSDDESSKNDVAVEFSQPKIENTIEKIDTRSAPVVEVLAKKIDAKMPDKRPAIYVPVERTPEIQENRLKLPILGMEQEIMEAINESHVVIICGETGSGKTTQIPQFLYEAGFCQDGRRVAVTEPRRVAAISMSRRVADELNLTSDVVSYQIRYEGNVGDATKIKFMTDGVLLKEIRQDFLLSDYSVVVIDEAHERSTYSDILIGLLSRVVVLREKRRMTPLKLIIMSATLRVDDFLSPKLFKTKPNVINVESRQFPVTVYFNRRTERDYLREAYKKCCKIHRLLPEGGILVFVSGQKEVHTLVSWLSTTFPKRDVKNVDIDEEENNLDDDSRRKKRRRKNISQVKTISLEAYKIEQYDLNDTDATDVDFFDDDDEEQKMNEIYERVDELPMFCLPLYSLLSSKKQALVFEPPPPGYRLCVVATNVAETSLTIPNVKYVVDTGREKIRAYDGVTGVSKFVVQWISKASAEQRAGRAGRTCSGKCYRLYSSAVFNEFLQFSQPEILNKPIDELVLLMKNMNILKVSNFPFPTSPDRLVLTAAEDRLIKLGALERQKSSDQVVKITALGKTMVLFPVSPSYAKILTLGHQQNLLPYVICLIAGLSVREPLINLSFMETNEDQKEEKLKEKISEQLRIRQEWCGRGESLLFGDLGVLLRAILESERNNFSASFCDRNGLRQKAMLEIKKMRRQLTKLINGLYPESAINENSSVPFPTGQQTTMLRQIFLAGLIENVAKKRTDLLTGSEKSLRNSYELSTRMKDPVFIHPTSVLRRRPPDYVVFNEIVDSNKKYMFNVMAVDPKWLNSFQATSGNLFMY